MHKGKPFFFLARRTAFSFLISRVQTSQSPSSNAFLPVPCLPFLLVSWKDFLRSNLPVECLYFLCISPQKLSLFSSAVKDLVGILKVLQSGLSLDVTPVRSVC